MKQKILVVDDDPTIMTFLEPLLSKKNYDGFWATDGLDALQKIKVKIPDLIISDIMMPRMDGYELYRRLREDPKTADIPFIFLSANTDPADQLKGLRMGANEYLTKPFDATNLFITITSVLANANRAKSSQERIDFSGNLAEIEFENIVQLIEMNQKTGELIFTTYENESFGSVFFKDGVMVNAVAGYLNGEEAFFDLASNREVYVKFFSKKINVPEMISSPTMSMLLEAARLQDEAKTLYTLIDDTDTRLRITDRSIPSGIDDAEENGLTSKVLQMIEQQKTIREIIHSGEMSRPRAASILVELINAGRLELEKKVEKTEDRLVSQQLNKKEKPVRAQIVTDSSVDLPDDVIRNRNIFVLPFNVQFGKEVYLDGFDITTDRFYEILKSTERIPRIYPLSDDEIYTVLADIISDKDMLCIFMSQKANFMFQNALNVVDMYNNKYLSQRMGKDAAVNGSKNEGSKIEGPKIEVIDSKMISMGMGLLVMEAIDKSDAGWSVGRIRKHIEQLIPSVRILLMVDSPEYLKHGWANKEVRAIKRNRKPIVGIQSGEGALALINQVKDGKEAQQLMERLMRENLLRYLGAPEIKVAVMHSNDPEWADEMSMIISNRFKCEKPIRSQIGPVAGAHFGPGAVGVAYYPVLEP
jgi:DegV family protein with EDD domain